MPVFGTCAGLILMSKQTGDARCDGLGLIDCTAKRNAYGRQLGSFDTTVNFKGLGKIPMVFIRAPYIAAVGDGVDVLARVDGKIVAARQGKFLATAFHPELTDDLSVHKYFIDMINYSSVSSSSNSKLRVSPQDGHSKLPSRTVSSSTVNSAPHAGHVIS